jgi:hypothetical protein
LSHSALCDLSSSTMNLLLPEPIPEVPAGHVGSNFSGIPDIAQTEGRRPYQES